MSLYSNLVQRDDRASQPDASTVAIGTLYFVTDEGVLERSNGTAWESYSGAGTGDVVGPASSTDHAVARFDGTSGVLLQDTSAVTLSDAGAFTFPDNVRQTFNPGANAAGINVGSVAGDPDTPSNGDLWYDSSANELTARINGANVALGAGGSGTVNNATVQGRLTTESGVPVSTSDRSAQSTIYFTPYQGNLVALYNGSAWAYHTLTEKSLALSGLTSGKNYDVFLYDNTGTLTLELSAAWTNDTTRADAIVLQDGVYVKDGATTRRLIGTIRTTGTTTTEDSGGGSTTQVGGKRFVWNLYNQVPRPMAVIDTSDSWSYTTDTWRQANGASGNKVEFVVGLSVGYVRAMVVASLQISSSSARAAKSGVGVDSITAPSGLRQRMFSVGASEGQMNSSYEAPIGLGYHYFAWLEKGGDGTNTWIGDAAGDGSQSGLYAQVPA